MRHDFIQAAPFDPEDLHGIRARVNAETGGEYVAFRSALHPRFGKVRLDLFLGYGALGAIALIVGWLGWLAVPLCAIGFGFTVAYLQLFIHEAAHFGLARSRTTNDRLANFLICWQVGTDIASYRATHWEHHRSLGGPHDTEVSYRNRLTFPFMVAMLTGFHAVRVFAMRKSAPVKGANRNLKPLIRGVAAHSLLLAGFAALGWWPAAVAWVAGMAIAFPFFATIRQLLEHRPVFGEDRSRAVTRIFADGWFSSIFGAAGFNRHMLHHLEPQVSYTRLRDLEHYLCQTSARQEIDARRTTYSRALAAILRSDRHA